MCLECELAGVVDDLIHCVVGTIVSVNADERVVDEKGKIVPEKVNALVFDQFQSGYYAVGEKVGGAWRAGAPLMKAAKG